MSAEETQKELEEIQKKIEKLKDEVKRVTKAKTIYKDVDFKFCHICKKLFSTVTARRLHMKRHEASRYSMRCKLCKKIFKSDKDGNIISHSQLKHDNLHSYTGIFKIAKHEQRKVKISRPKKLVNFDAEDSEEDFAKEEDDLDGSEEDVNIVENEEEEDVGKLIVANIGKIIEDGSDSDIDEEDFAKRRRTLFKSDEDEEEDA